MGSLFRVSAVLAGCLLIGACAGGRVWAPVSAPGEKQPEASGTSPSTQKPQSVLPAEARPRSHRVAQGDTLYSIAFNYGFDYRDVAAWNSIKAPYTIYPGQQIVLQSPMPQTTAPSAAAQERAQPLTPGPIVSKRATTATETKTGINTVDKSPPPATVSEKAPAPDRETTATISKQPVVAGPLQWSWPARGKLIKSNTPIAQNGIDIAGNAGQQINASAAGEVVYSGSGLLGYGRLIIIKHNDTYLSAYAHNDQLLVKEGEQVAAGQPIASMGKTNDGRTLLHFEIRKNGQPVNPLSYLPRI